MEFQFTLMYKLDSDETDQEAIVERLGESGCTDALIGIGVPGRIALDFTREAKSAETALLSAIADVKRAIPTATLIEAGPDLVGITDIADLMQVTRQNIRKLSISHSNFPMPVHSGTSAIYHLSEVLVWLSSRGSYQLIPGILEVAKTTQQINLARSAKKIKIRQAFVNKLEALIA